jgi:SAM-dependent methyltransferase
MEGLVLTLRGAAYRLSTGFRAVRDRALYPTAEDPAEHWMRVVRSRAVDARIAAAGPSRCTAAEISGGNHAGRPWKEYTRLDYPEFDLCATPTDERRFDVVICEEVLEHVADPWAAAANLRTLCAPGGLVIVSTPFMLRVHELPQYGMYDYWRFTPRGMRILLEGAGLEIETIDSWGNRQCVSGNIAGWSARRPWHSLRNEPDVPLQVWAFARNSGDG